MPDLLLLQSAKSTHALFSSPTTIALPQRTCSRLEPGLHAQLLPTHARARPQRSARLTFSGFTIASNIIAQRLPRATRVLTRGQPTTAVLCR